MTLLARWLDKQLQQRALTLRAAAAGSGVSIATLSTILHRGHIPKGDTLLRLADYLGAPRDQVLSLAAGLPHATARAEPEAGAGPPLDDDFLIQELIAEFRQVPDEWKEEALAQVAFLARLAKRPPARIIGSEEEEDEEQRPPSRGA
jgi:transcriptional regulator with XRE-family HTH domain